MLVFVSSTVTRHHRPTTRPSRLSPEERSRQNRRKKPRKPREPLLSLEKRKNLFACCPRRAAGKKSGTKKSGTTLTLENETTGGPETAAHKSYNRAQTPRADPGRRVPPPPSLFPRVARARVSCSARPPIPSKAGTAIIHRKRKS